MSKRFPCLGPGKHGDRKCPVEWPVSFTWHSNPQNPIYARQTPARHFQRSGPRRGRHRCHPTQQRHPAQLTLTESKKRLSTLQRRLLQQQVDTFLDAHSTCPDCGVPLELKAHGSRSFRTLFGTFKLYSPRLKQCGCQQREISSFRPLSALLTESVER